MKTLSNLHEVVSSCGNILRGSVDVQGKEFRVEANTELTWVNIIDDDSRCETCVIDEDGDVVSEGGEYVTEAWTDADWLEFTAYVGVKAAKTAHLN